MNIGIEKVQNAGRVQSEGVKC